MTRGDIIDMCNESTSPNINPTALNQSTTITVLNHPMEIKETNTPPLPADAYNSEDPNNEYEACEQLLAKAVLMKWQQNYQVAHQITTHCIENYPDYYHAYFQHGLTYHSMQKPNEAIKSFHKSMSCHNIPQSYVHIASGWIAYLEKRTEDAEQEFDRAVQVDPKCSYAYFSRGYVQDVRKKLDDAVVSFHKSLECVPRYSPCGVYNNIAWCYEQMTDKKDEALEYYSKAIACNGTFVRALYNRAKLQQDRKEADKAIEDLENIIKINITHLYSYLELGDIYWFDKNDKDNAMRYYTMARNVIDPTNCYAYLLIASIHSFEKKLPSAIAELDYGIRHCHRPEFILELLRKKVTYNEKYMAQLITEIEEEERNSAISQMKSMTLSPPAAGATNNKSNENKLAVTTPRKNGLTIQIAKKDSPAAKRQQLARIEKQIERDNNSIKYSVDNFYCSKLKTRLKAILFVPFNMPSSPVPYTPPSVLKKPFGSLQRNVFDVVTPTPSSYHSSLHSNSGSSNLAPSPVVGDPIDYKYYVYYFYDTHNTKLSSVLFSDCEILTFD
ncbi:transmembrane and TPR repeat-containing protein [Acrasis kona]|uniref:Transmembrane and TPR repeat-containing protein n=1 Tax=Acrasis kona TaxID=1008807 RepID=A0AAW2ZF93_9EUKA